MLRFHCVMKIWPFIYENTQKKPDDYEDFFSVLVYYLTDMPIYF